MEALTAEWHATRPALIQKWTEAAHAHYAPYKATATEVKNYVRQQESIWWHNKRKELESK